MNEEDAKRLAIKEGDTVLLTLEEVMLKATASVSDRCQPGGVVVPRVSDWQGVNSLIGVDGVPAWVGVRKV